MKNILAIIVVIGLTAMFIAAEVIARKKRREKMRSVLQMGRRIVFYANMPLFDEIEYISSGEIIECCERIFLYKNDNDKICKGKYSTFGQTAHIVEVYDGDKLVYTNCERKL